MIKIINFNDFIDAFERTSRKEQFSYDGKQALFNYLEQYEEETGEQVELDVIALCCEYTEYSDIKELQKNYGEEYETIEDLEQVTTVIPIDEESFIIQDF